MHIACLQGVKPVLLIAVLLAAGCESAPPQRDVFVPPYAEKGCWARFYGAPDFGTPMRQVEGPIEVEALDAASITTVPDVQTIGVQPLFREVRSLVVGPSAKIVGYAQPLFREPSLVVDPGTPVRDVATLGFHDRVASFEVRCTAG